MSYVALGDSYASGEGLAPYEPGAGGCRRSSRSYPSLLGATGPERFSEVTSAACSGAVTGDILGTQVSALASTTRTVTLTVGGNDVGFATVVAACLHTTDPRLRMALEGYATQTDAWRRRLRAGVEQRVAFLGGPAAVPRDRSLPLVRVLADVARRAPDAQILVTGYPRLLGQQPGPQGHRASDVLPLFVRPEDADWLTEQNDALNAAVASGVERARAGGVDARFVDVAAGFGGHGLSDAAAPWVNGVVLATVGSLVPDSSSFHLTAEGQAAYAAAVAAA